MNRTAARWKVSVLLALGSIGIALSGCTLPPFRGVVFSQSADTVEAYDFVEVVAGVRRPAPRNPYTDATLAGWFETVDGSRRWQVEGFCDQDNGTFRIRFMPPAAGDYRYEVKYSQGWGSRSWKGSFHATDGHRRGPIRVDSLYPWHFVWEGTGEHYFFNGTTAYWLMGWHDDEHHPVHYRTAPPVEGQSHPSHDCRAERVSTSENPSCMAATGTHSTRLGRRRRPRTFSTLDSTTGASISDSGRKFDRAISVRTRQRRDHFGGAGHERQPGSPGGGKCGRNQILALRRRAALGVLEHHLGSGRRL